MNNAGPLKTKNMLIIEPDMRPMAYADDDPYSSKVFKNMPLIGDLRISEATLEKLHANAKRYVDNTLNSREKPKYSQWLYEQVAILVVNYAKKWNSNEEGKFSRYIAMQFGYKDDSGKIWRIITEALDIAFNRNNKYFIKANNGDRQFYETVMAHSFGPADSWTPMIELLFKFYTENLDWNYVPGDPLFARLVAVLRKYFDNTVTEDDKFLIASNYYHLRIGIRRLTQDRPGYCAFLFEQIVRRIHQLIHNEAKETKKYSLSLVDEWFVNRISKNDSTTGRNKNIRKENVEVALDYSKISVKYTLSNGMPSLRIPAIRLTDDNPAATNILIYYGDTLVDTVPLQVRGNELGRTVQSKTISLPLDKWNSKEINLRAIIKTGDNIIFDSEKTLFRQVILFSDGKEISPSRLRREKYQLYAIDRDKLTGTNIDIVPFLNGMCEISLHKNYALEYADNTIAVDSSEISGIRLVKPTVSEKAVFMRMGESFFIASPETSLKIYFTDEQIADKYHVLINGENHSLSEYFDKVSGNRSVIPFSAYDKNEEINLSIVDLSTGSIIYNQKYLILPEFKVDFEQQYYVVENSINPINVKITIGKEEYFVESSNNVDVSLEYLDGAVLVDIPSVQHRFIGIDRIFLDKYIQITDIDENSVLQVENHTGLDCVVLIGEVAFQNESLISLGWLKNRNQYKATDQEIYIEINGKKKLIGKVIVEDQFVSLPKIIYQEGSLLWDGGKSFIGNQETVMQLQLAKNERVSYEYPLFIGKSEIATSDLIEDGHYNCKIFSQGSLLVEFNTFIGDERKARFTDRIIKIEHVTEDFDNNSSAVKVKPVYINQIKYVDTCYVETEDDIFDVYTGCLYWIDYKGEKRYFSFKYNDARSKYKVNPVKIIYISNRYLRIVNEDDEGIFYFNNEYSSTPGNEITDVEPKATAHGYHDILFYIYTTESKNPAEKPTDILPYISEEKDADETIDDSREELGNKEVGETLAIFPNIEETTQDTVIKTPVNARILVNAGPGTGKTWTLIERIIFLIQEGVDPESIQVLCFSRAAVDVVRQRMNIAIEQGQVDINSRKVDIRTFDSFASQLLYWVQNSDYGEISASQQIESLSYEERIKKFIEVLRAEPQLIEQCNHLIVDEVQDLVLSRAEMVIEMVKRLPSESGVTLFGDACQAIYDYQVEDGVSSTDFYNRIQKRGDFKCFSFTKNYRQISELQDYCSHYRNAILANDMDLCKNSASKLYDDLPEYTIKKIQSFQEDSLDFLTETGNLGILTRSNAQALMISSIFRKKNIPHMVQRRLTEDAVNGWVAILFNQSPIRYYNEEDFVVAFEENCANYLDLVDPHEIWEALSDTYSATTGRLSVKNLLVSIKSKGKCKGLFTEAQESPITISTIHRSKGREYDSVILLDDLLSEETEVPEEHRVNYVALSRAKSRMYKVSFENTYFRTLDDRRCYSVGTTFKSFKSGSHYLRNFEIGKKNDFIATSYAFTPEVQKFIRSNNIDLIGKEVYLKRDKVQLDGNVTYQLILSENDMVLATTSQDFSYDLREAIREIKNLPSFARIYEQLYPTRFSGIYITDITSEIGMAQGEEKDIVEHEGFTTWSSLMLEGYAKAEYLQER